LSTARIANLLLKHLTVYSILFPEIGNTFANTMSKVRFSSAINTKYMPLMLLK